jgi:hypothetical protein
MQNPKPGICLSAMYLIAIVPLVSLAQKQKTHRKKEIYFSWGYNTEWYTRSNVHVSQPSLGNDYTFVNIKGHDLPGWDQSLFHMQLTIPQYNYRLGIILNEEKGWGFEINFDHTKFIFADQNAHIKGRINNKGLDTTVVFNQENGFYYYLNNGANFLLFNLVKRWNLYLMPNEKIKLDILGKAGIGPVIPHVQNSLFGQANNPGFQFGGWNTGVEGSLRATFFKYVYLEYSNKLDYARYSNLGVYKGTAKQAFGSYQMVLSLGLTFPTGKKS